MVETLRCLAFSCVASPHSTKFSSVIALQNHLYTRHKLKITGLSGLSTTNINVIKVCLQYKIISVCRGKYVLLSLTLERQCNEDANILYEYLIEQYQSQSHQKKRKLVSLIPGLTCFFHYLAYLYILTYLKWLCVLSASGTKYPY